MRVTLDEPTILIEPRGKAVASRRPNDVWHADLTTVPTSLGFWTFWMPRTLPQCWPFCWWAVVVIDHYSLQSIIPTTEGRIIKLQDMSQGAGDVPDMRLILNWGLSRLVAEKR